jgi:hypothetical protein
MVYTAYGISGLTGIVGTFFVKSYLGLSAELLSALMFWVNIPSALKMPLGHLVDLIWRFKAGMVFPGAGLIALSLLIMIALLSHPGPMRDFMPLSAWYVIRALLAAVGYVVQDVVADAMTVEAVPRVDHAAPLSKTRSYWYSRTPPCRRWGGLGLWAAAFWSRRSTSTSSAASRPYPRPTRHGATSILTVSRRFCHRLRADMAEGPAAPDRCRRATGARSAIASGLRKLTASGGKFKTRE